MIDSEDHYLCPICGHINSLSEGFIHRELNACLTCGSNTRFRATILSLLSAFQVDGGAYSLSSAPANKQISGIGVSDSAVYSELLAAKFSYLNTFLHGEPFLDIEKRSSFIEYKPIDFIICNDVLEHTILPPSEVIPILHEALEPGGVLVLCAPTYRLPHHVEKYPSFDSYETKETSAGDFHVEIKSKFGPSILDVNPCFHGGPGRVLEVRLISEDNLRFNLQSVGFEVSQVATPLLRRYGAWWPEVVERADVPVDAIGKPLICRKRHH
jgi:hypothetical protein